ncbi:MAG: lamin tail domain-containing protein [Methanoregulaceae archaeon]|nr:lamin tail domain-containing protein [Methanoregulaceae archaeon]
MIPVNKSLLVISLIVATCLFAGCSMQKEFSPGSDNVSDNPVRATVVETIDGDTLHLSFPDGRRETLRILGIDAPEVTPERNDPGKFNEVADKEILSLWGEEAASYTKRKLNGQQVTIIYDRDAGTRDVYGRMLATIITPDGTDHGEDLIRKGLARVYMQETFSRKDHYLAVQKEAITTRTGIWSGREPVQGMCREIVISTVHYDAAGDDRENLNDEYITIRNRGPTTADLTGWQIRDSDGFVYILPAVSLPSGKTMNLYTGNGTSSQGSLSMGSPVPVLNNDGDTVNLIDGTGNHVSSFSWG